MLQTPVLHSAAFVETLPFGKMQATARFKQAFMLAAGTSTQFCSFSQIAQKPSGLEVQFC
jgi:hypothetical protein